MLITSFGPSQIQNSTRKQRGAQKLKGQQCWVCNMTARVDNKFTFGDIHHHFFICRIIQQYTHLHGYGLEEQDSKVR